MSHRSTFPNPIVRRGQSAGESARRASSQRDILRDSDSGRPGAVGCEDDADADADAVRDVRVGWWVGRYYIFVVERPAERCRGGWMDVRVGKGRQSRLGR